MTDDARTLSPGAGSGWWRALPWTDATGRFSAVRLAVLALLCLPAAMVAWRYAAGALGPRPLNAAVHEIGNWALRLLLLSLAVRPARDLLRWRGVMALRRMIGVTVFVYAAIHILLYAADEAFDLGKVVVEIVLRVYLTIGSLATFILLMMAATSTDGMVRQLGGRGWQRLHRLVYAAAFLSVIHFFMQVKADVDEPWVMAGLFAWLIGWRLLAARARRGVTDGRLAALAVAAAAVTALGEAVYYGIKLGAPPLQVLAVNLTLDAGLRPAAVVLAIGAGVTVAALLRRRLAGGAGI